MFPNTIMDSRVLITISALHIYPVKSLGGIHLKEAELTERGLRHDRRFMVVDPQGECFTQRNFPKMATVWTEIADGELRLAAPDAGEVAVEAEPDDGEEMSVRVWRSTCPAIAPSAAADRWLSDFLESPVRLVYMPDYSQRPTNPSFAQSLVSFADGYPILVTNEDSLADLNARLSRPVPMNRFRPNVVVRGAGAFAEDGWGEFDVGETRLKMVKPCGRCQVTTTDQTTGGVTGPEPLSALAQFRDKGELGACFGMNAVVVSGTRVRVGDQVAA